MMYDVEEFAGKYNNTAIKGRPVTVDRNYTSPLYITTKLCHQIAIAERNDLI